MKPFHKQAGMKTISVCYYSIYNTVMQMFFSASSAYSKSEYLLVCLPRSRNILEKTKLKRDFSYPVSIYIIVYCSKHCLLFLTLDVVMGHDYVERSLLPCNITSFSSSLPYSI